VVTTTGGGAAMVVDRLAMRGVDVVAPTPETAERMRAGGVEATPGRIVDLTLAGTRYDVMKAALDTMLAAPEFDLVLAVVGSSARFRPELAVKPIVDSAGASRPLAAFLVPEAPDALLRLAESGVPSFRTPESCADAVAAALTRRSPVSRDAVADVAGEPRMLDELQAYEVLDRVGLVHAPAVAIETGIDRAPDLPFAYPVAAKVLSAEITHKSDIGGVAIGIRDARSLLEAVARMQSAIGSEAQRFLVQEMVSGVGEVLLGYRIDHEVGPLVMLAAGGVLTEIYQDRVVRLAPVTYETAREMIDGVRGLKALRGYRGKPAGDMAALAEAIVALSRLAGEPAIIEAEINPLIVREAGKGVVAVDAVVRRRA
jgi:acyl-CoA synthetase (NDP forming)